MLQIPAELNIAGLGPKRFGLEPKQDQPGSRAVRNAHRFGLPMGAAPHAGFNDEAHALTVNLPAFVVSKLSVGQGGLTPA